MSGHVEFVFSPQQYTKKRHGGAYQVTLSEAQDWARLWPREDGVSPVFRLLVLPVRLAALALLWATSSPGRLLVGVGLAAVVALALIVH